MPESGLFFEQMSLGPMQNFIYLIGCQKTRECLVVDPAWDIDALVQRAQEAGYSIRGALVTHYHPDHVGGSFFGFQVPGGVAELLEQVPDAAIHVNKHEAEGLAKVTGVPLAALQSHDSGDKVRVGEIDIELIHTPGHTPGSQCFLVDGRLVSGDTLFIQGCGRVDLPGANPEDMYRSLTQKLALLPDDTVLYPGHHYDPKPSEQLGVLKRSNHYLRVPDMATWLAMMG